MLQLHNLRPNAGARKDAKRVARGLNNGSGVGNAGQNSRSGPSYVRGFEGGRTPVWKRIPQLPEFVVSLQNMKKPAILQLDMLQRLFDIGKLKRPLVTPQDLYAAGVKGMEHGLGREYFHQENVSLIASLLDAASIASIERLGGSVLCVSCTQNGWRKLTQPDFYDALKCYRLMPPSTWEERCHYSRAERRGYLSPEARELASPELLALVEQNFVLCPPSIPMTQEQIIELAQRKVKIQ